MKKYLTAIIGGIICVLLIIVITQLAALRTEVNYQGNNIAGRLSSLNGELQYDINSYSTEPSLLSMSEYQLANFDKEALTADLKVSLIPRETTGDAPTATLIINGTEYPMQFAQGEFTATVPMSIFDQLEVNRVLIKDDSSEQTEVLLWDIIPAEKYLPHIQAEPNWQSCYSNGRYEYNADVTIHYSYSETAIQLDNMVIKSYRDGQLMETTELSAAADNRHSDEYMTEGTYWDDFSYNSSTLSASLAAKLTAEDIGSSYEWVFEATDQAGNSYKQVLQQLSFDGNNTPISEGRGFHLEVYSVDNVLLYTYENWL